MIPASHISFVNAVWRHSLPNSWRSRMEIMSNSTGRGGHDELEREKGRNKFMSLGKWGKWELKNSSWEKPTVALSSHLQPKMIEAVKWRDPDTKGCKLDDSVYMTCPA